MSFRRLGDVSVNIYYNDVSSTHTIEPQTPKLSYSAISSDTDI